MSTDPKKEFGRRIWRARKAAGLNQEQLAALIERTKETVSSLELGKSEPGMETLQRLINALNVPASFFLNERAKSAKRAAIDERLVLAARELSDKDAELLVGIAELMRESRRR